MSKQLYLQGIFNEYMGRRDQAFADLNTLLDSPAGIGDHGDLSKEIKDKLKRISHLDGMVDLMRRYFSAPEAPSDIETPPVEGNTSEDNTSDDSSSEKPVVDSPEE
tara:strand:- start:128 stop:445 length:318 start_codon:yes stop_codon:yes gene_type:complete